MKLLLYIVCVAGIVSLLFRLLEAPWGGWDSQWRTFDSIVSAPLTELERAAVRKPVGVFETSSADLGGDKEEWGTAALDSARSLGLGALVWFQVNKEIDWRLQTHVSAAVRSAMEKENASIPMAK